MTFDKFGYKWKCVKGKSQYIHNKTVYVPSLFKGKRFLQPKYVSIGEQDEYNTLNQCKKAVQKLERDRINNLKKWQAAGIYP